MDLKEFEQIEKMKLHFRKQFIEEINDKIKSLKYSPDDTPRDGSTYKSEDRGYHHGISQVQDILKSLLTTPI